MILGWLRALKEEREWQFFFLNRSGPEDPEAAYINRRWYTLYKEALKRRKITTWPRKVQRGPCDKMQNAIKSLASTELQQHWRSSDPAISTTAGDEDHLEWGDGSEPSRRRIREGVTTLQPFGPVGLRIWPPKATGGKLPIHILPARRRLKPPRHHHGDHR
jgi:hypothetical protein